MPFMKERGRAPVANEEVGTVSWDEDKNCFVGSNGFYWYGREYGGWQEEPPPEDLRKRPRPKKERKGVNTKGRPPKPVTEDESIEYDDKNLCWKTDRDGGLFWHGTYNGGWKENAPSEEERTKNRPKKKKMGKGNQKGRPPRRETDEEKIEYDDENLCWKTDRDGGLFWHGTFDGGWKDSPP